MCQYKTLILTLLWGYILFFLNSPFGIADQGYYLYDDFESGVIDPSLWHKSGPVAIEGGKVILGTEGVISAAKRNLIGMQFSVKGYQSITVNQHVNIHMATLAPEGGGIVLGENIQIFPPAKQGDPPSIYKKVFCNFCPDGMFDREQCIFYPLLEAQWDNNYIFGLEYTENGSVNVIVNGNIMASFIVKKGEMAYKNGAYFWFKADAIEYDGGGNVSAEIYWAKAKRVKKPLIVIMGIADTEM